MENDDDSNIVDEKDIIAFITASIEQNGIMDHNIAHYSDLIDNGISSIMKNHFNMEKSIDNNFKSATTEEREINGYTIKISFDNISVETPKQSTYYKQKIMNSYDGDISQNLYPYDARRNSIPYSGMITLSINIKIIALKNNKQPEEREFSVKNLKIGAIPIMVGSSKCNTRHCSREMLKMKHEDPDEIGGMFIAKGLDWVIDQAENIRYNTPHIYAKIVASERARCEFISQSGNTFANSIHMSIRFLESGAITIELKSQRFNKKVQIPFYIFYRIFNMSSDIDITNTIVYDYNSSHKNTKEMLKYLEVAFHKEDPSFVDRSYNSIVQKCAEKMLKIEANHSTKQITSYNKTIQVMFLEQLDKYTLPHVGEKSDSRIKKLRFIGYLIHRTFLVHMGVLPSSDRDNLANKRAHGAGISIAKAFKSQVNTNCATSVLRAVTNELSSKSFYSLDDNHIAKVVKNAIRENDMNKNLERCITTSKTEIVTGNKVMANRVSSQQLELKNPLNKTVVLRTMSSQKSSNKTTARADEMRRVHPSYTGYICVVQSADSGEKVGMKKQLAITATICMAGDAVLLKGILMNDIIPINEIDSKTSLQYHKVFVDGNWIGFCENSYILRKKYIEKRRNGEIDKFTTICVNPVLSEIHFWLDVGRLTRPILIVDNNKLRLTKEHINKINAGQITLNDLIHEQVCEYLTPEEVENCLIAPSLQDLVEQNSLTKINYTHCEVPQAIFGFAALMFPYGQHTRVDRITLATCQLKQAAGIYSKLYPYRQDTNRMLQIYNERPLVDTLASRYITPSGYNCIVAYANYMGENQEDSTVVNKRSIDLGLFSGIFYRTQTNELNPGCTFCIPNVITTKNYKKNACYEKLSQDGIVRIGEKVKRGDIIIGIIQKMSKPFEGMTHEDKSIGYNHNEDAIVDDSFITIGPNGEKFACIKMRYYRSLIVGDKMCFTPDHQIRTIDGWTPITECKGASLYITPDSKSDFVDCLEFFEYDIDEEIIHIDIVELRVTKNHKLYLRKPESQKYRLYEAGDVDFSAYYKSEGQEIFVPKTAYNPQYYKGKVYCVSSMSGLIYCKNNKSKFAVWSGNSSRCGNKTIVARVIPSIDMPFCENGLQPDIIISPQSFVSRMAISQCLETLSGQLAGIHGSVVDATSFLPHDPYKVQEELVKYGFKANGKMVTRDGVTGEYMTLNIFIGPTYQERLQKFVIDDEQYNGRNVPVDQILGQPLAHFAVRIGEMEKDNFNALGIMKFSHEKMSTDSDGCVIYICRTCGGPAVINTTGTYRYICKTCGDNANIVSINSTKSAFVFMEYVAGAGINMTFNMAPYSF